MSPLQQIRDRWSAPMRRALLISCVIVLGGLFLGWMRFGRASLEITPDVFPQCKGPDIVVHVTWDATAVTKKPVYLLVHKPGQAPTVWTLTAPNGEADTGKWASDGWTVVLADIHHRRLAKRTLETVPCMASKR